MHKTADITINKDLINTCRYQTFPTPNDTWTGFNKKKLEKTWNVEPKNSDGNCILQNKLFAALKAFDNPNLT